MTDNDIKKALSVLNGGHSCKNCKYDNGKGDDRCGLKGCKIARYALDLINRLEAENKRLKNAVNRLTHRVYDLKEKDEIRHKVFMTKCEELETAKAEAYKEFAERFVQKAEKTKIIYIADKTIQEQETGWYQISIADFDNLYKELVGEDND